MVLLPRKLKPNNGLIYPDQIVDLLQRILDTSDNNTTKELKDRIQRLIDRVK